MHTKTCITCNQEKHIDQFPLEGQGGKFRRNKCRACVAKWRRLPADERAVIKQLEADTIRTRVEKICPSCNELKPRSAFYAKSSTLDGMTTYCRSCDDHRTKAHSRATYMANLTDEAAPTTLTCRTCQQEKPVHDFNRSRHRVTGFDSQCKQCKSAIWKERATDEARVRYLLQRIQSKCEKNDIPFDLELSDLVVPDKCPVLGIPLRFGKSDKGYTSNADESSPSVDRIDPTKGYTKDNIIVISWRANRIKGNATPEELKMLADFYCKKQFAK